MHYQAIFGWSGSYVLEEYASLALIPINMFIFGWLLPSQSKGKNPTSDILKICGYFYVASFPVPLYLSYFEPTLPPWVFPTLLVGSLVSTFPSYVVGMAVIKLLGKNMPK